LYNRSKRSPNAYVISEQPQDIENIFTLGSGEKILNTYECDDRCCGFGPKYVVTLTDARIIQREKRRCCCCHGARVDSMLFLSDISSIKNKVEYNCVHLIFGILLPNILLCCLPLLCTACHCIKGVPITLHGPFGAEVFTLDRSVVLSALGEIPKAALPHKILTQPSQSSMQMQASYNPPRTQLPPYPSSSHKAKHTRADDSSAF
jgi:hypothetical protein